MSEFRPHIDFRSDTVTRPSPGMRAAMAAAEVGDDVFGDDPTVSRLEQEVAARFGKEAGLFVPTGTQSNLIAILSHCQRGDEYICGQDMHAYRWEGGGAAVLGSVQPQPLAHELDGTIALEAIEAAIKPDDPHFAVTRLVSMENTLGGRVLPLDYLRAVTALAHKHGLATHLDGARVFNAATACGVSVAAIAEGFDTVSVCLSKGLGSPAGSVLVGPGELITRGRRWRKVLGGSMRQSGVLAAAGMYALEHNVDRLAQDHANAQRLAEGLCEIPDLQVVSAQTNMVFLALEPALASRLTQTLWKRGIAVGNYGGRTMRLVTHLDINAENIDEAVEAIRRSVHEEQLTQLQVCGRVPADRSQH